MANQKIPIQSPFTADSKSVAIEDLVDAYVAGTLKLQPWFQRNPIWNDRARFGLIDTIFRKLPVPEIFLWIDPANGNWLVVDGQQRLRAIIEYMLPSEIQRRTGQRDPKNPNFQIKHLANSSISIHSDLRNKAFSQLEKKHRDEFKGYKINYREIQGGTREDVEGLFHRLNTHVVEMNAQELRNATSHGDMIILARDLTKEFQPYLVGNKIRTINQCARLTDTDSVINEILLCAVKEEITGSDKKIKDDLYKSNKTMHKDRRRLEKKIIATKNMIEKILPADILKTTMFTKHTNYLALFTALYLAVTGEWTDPKTYAKTKYTINPKKIKKLRRSLEDFSKDVTNGIEDRSKRIRGGRPVTNFVDAFVERHTTETRVRLKKCTSLKEIMMPHLQKIDTTPILAKERQDIFRNWNERSTTNNKPLCGVVGYPCLRGTSQAAREIKEIEDMDVNHKKKVGKGGGRGKNMSNWNPMHKSCNRHYNQL